MTTYDEKLLNTTSITGRSLAGRLRHMNAVQRAILAARIVEGKVALVDLTARSIAELCCVSVPYMAAAARLSDEDRLSVLRGKHSLLEPNQPCPRYRAPAPAIDYSAELERILADAINRIGTDPVLDAALAAEQQA
jgi:hypothetical protein